MCNSLFGTRGALGQYLGSKTPPKLELVLHFQLSFALVRPPHTHAVGLGTTKNKGGRCREHRTPLPQQQQQRVAVSGAFGRPECELQPVAPAAACLAAAAVQAYQPEMPNLPATHSLQTVVIIMFESFACAALRPPVDACPAAGHV